MTLRVFRSRKRTNARVAIGAIALIVDVLSAGPVHAQDAEAVASPVPITATPLGYSDPFAGRFPNVVLKTHQGKNVRFYDDLLKGKIVLINFFYVTCTER